MLISRKIAPLLLLVIFSSGCGEKQQNGSSTADPASKAAPPVQEQPDDADAVKALTDGGFSLKTNEAGNVVECAINTSEDISSLLVNLAGIPNVKIATLSGPALTDAGMENLAMLTNVERLNLSDSAIGDETLKSVAKLKKLKGLLIKLFEKKGIKIEESRVDMPLNN